jgi:hypothetical protein
VIASRNRGGRAPRPRRSMTMIRPAEHVRCAARGPPIASDYLGGGQVRHHWVCDPCGHAWTTAVRMLS